MTVNDTWGDEEIVLNGQSPIIAFEIEAVDRIKSIEILRNSEVIKNIKPTEYLKQTGNYVDKGVEASQTPLYYYIRVIQENNHIAWSSPVWFT
jgi:hypothetical protein